MRMPTLKSELIYMADGLFLYEKENSYVVMDQNDNILKEAKTSKTCSSYILKILQSRRAAEKYVNSLNELKVLGIL
jgi:hypothetical protein